MLWIRVMRLFILIGCAVRAQISNYRNPQGRQIVQGIHKLRGSQNSTSLHGYRTGKPPEHMNPPSLQLEHRIISDNTIPNPDQIDTNQPSSSNNHHPNPEDNHPKQGSLHEPPSSNTHTPQPADNHYKQDSPHQESPRLENVTPKQEATALPQNETQAEIQPQPQRTFNASLGISDNNSTLPEIGLNATARDNNSTLPEMALNATGEVPKLDPNRITEEAQRMLAECPAPLNCFRHMGFYGYALDYYNMIDSKRKILMEFSPKADCTAAVVTFLESMGFRRGEQYFGWPHEFRDNHYTPRCGRAKPCHYYAPDWFRFKVVRNPFDRAVSSYIATLDFLPAREMYPESLWNASFEQFVDYQLSLSPDQLQYFVTRHAGPQSQFYERFVYSENLKRPSSSPKLPPVFHEIVHAEDSEAAFERIYRRTNASYKLNFISHHFRKRDSDVNFYVGNMSWGELNNNLAKIPRNYGYFYNEAVKQKVEKLYEWDLLLYNYTFPFQDVLDSMKPATATAKKHKQHHSSTSSSSHNKHNDHNKHQSRKLMDFFHTPSS